MTHRKVEHCLQVDATELRQWIEDIERENYTGGGRDGCPIDFQITPTARGTFLIQLRTRQQSPVTARVLMTPTVPTFGGNRWWFECPWCERRCRVLYVPIPGGRFGCRRRLELRYRSQSRRPQEQRQWKMEQLKFRLGARGYGTAPVAPVPPRPKRMHWNTYMKLVGKLRALEGAYWQTTGEYVQRRSGQRIRY
jgi:hypothetical protein